MMALAVLLVYFLCRSNDPVKNEGALSMDDETVAEVENVLPMNEDIMTEAPTEAPTESAVPEDDAQYFEQRDYAPPEEIYLKGKFNRRNKAKRGYRKVNYRDAKRGDFGRDDWTDFIDRHNNILADGQKGYNDQFQPMDETNGGLAVFKTASRETCGSNQDCNPEDLFDADKYLPQEVNDDWFEVQAEPVSVKNRHLINVTKPIGINTIGTSLRNSSYDVRGSPANPRFVVSPWLQSSIEPDHNIKPLM